ncbi:MAG: 5-dehydro-2-deoxygluconokinase [Acidimicrobiales bacterium]
MSSRPASSRGTGPRDVITIGRSGVDIYPQQAGPLEDVTSFSKFLGGSPTNVAVAAARFGWDVAVITRVGKDPFGRYVRRAIRDLGVDDAFVTEVTGLPTPVTFCEMFPPDHFPLYFYRYPKAPDLEIRPEEIDTEAVRTTRLFWATVTGLSEEPSRSAHHEAWRARQRQRFTVLDLDYRQTFWTSEEMARAEISRALPHVTVALGNREECEVAVGELDPDRAADALLDRGVELAVVKQGPNGVLGKTKHERVVCPAVPVDVVNGLGAGDAFGGALCNGLLAGWPLEHVLNVANVAGALVASRRETSTAMPTSAEVDAYMSRLSNV